MKRHYHYVIEGRDANGNGWTSEGELSCEYNDVFAEASKATFLKLTNGKAIYGKPGVGCKGPYVIEQVRISLAEQ